MRLLAAGRGRRGSRSIQRFFEPRDLLVLRLKGKNVPPGASSERTRPVEGPGEPHAPATAPGLGRGAGPGSAVQCSAVPGSAVQCSAVQCSAAPSSAVQYTALQRSAVTHRVAELTVEYLKADTRSEVVDSARNISKQCIMYTLGCLQVGTF